MVFDFLIVGSGFAGSIVAERLAHSGKKIMIIDKRDHIGGNAYDKFDENGVLVHLYGPHIFHTNSERIFNYLSEFTNWRNYEHRVLTSVEGNLLPIPINLTTLNKLYNLNLNEEGAKLFLEKIREHRATLLTSEDVVLNSVGREIYEKFYKGYTKKQWGLDPSELDASVTARIPIRTNTDDRYFTDQFQAMPDKGYTEMFKNMLSNKNIRIECGVDFIEAKQKIKAKHIVYTGPIDAYFNYCFGKLPYRSLFFQHEHFTNLSNFQCTGTINYPNNFDYTRITEFKYLTGQNHSGTSIVREFPQENGDPFYPIPNQKNQLLYKKYHSLSQNEKNTSFIGRLAQYKYYNMDQVTGAALNHSEKLLS